MELRQLKTFVRIAELRSFTRAADALFLTQPAVTRQVAALERELGARLFERMGRRVHLTTAGDQLLEYAQRMLLLAQEARRAVDDVAHGHGGRLAVGASSTTATYVLPPLLQQFRADHPGVELSVHTGVSAQVAERVLTNDVDLGVVTGARDHPDLVAVPLMEYATGIVVYPEHPLAAGAARDGVAASELAGCPLIVMEEGTNLRTYVDGLLSAAGVEERVAMELDNVEAIKKMIEARLGISLLPLLAVAGEVEAGRLVARPLGDVPGANRRIEAIYRRDKYQTAALRAFLELLRAAAAASTPTAQTAKLGCDAGAT